MLVLVLVLLDAAVGVDDDDCGDGGDGCFLGAAGCCGPLTGPKRARQTSFAPPPGKLARQLLPKNLPVSSLSVNLPASSLAKACPPALSRKLARQLPHLAVSFLGGTLAR